MGYQKWSYELLHGFCMDAFEKFGFTEAEANIIQDVLLTADLYGIESHGMQRMVRYHKCIEKGMIHVDAKPEVVFETPVSAVVDWHDGAGNREGKEVRRGHRLRAQLQSFRHCGLLCEYGVQRRLDRLQLHEQ